MTRGQRAKILKFPERRREERQKEDMPLAGAENMEAELSEIKRQLIDLHSQNEQIAELLDALEKLRSQSASDSRERSEITRRIAELRQMRNDNHREKDELIRDLQRLEPQVFSGVQQL